jgi:hypothetical protein
MVYLPVNPEKLPVERSSENSDYNVLGIGPVMVARTPALKVVTISSWFPGRPISGLLGSFHPPEYYIDFFEKAMTEKTPVKYTPQRYFENGEPFMTGTAGMMMLVTQFDTEERGGETGDFYYDLTLTEYRDYAPQTFQLQQQETGKAAVASAEPSRSIPQGQLYVGCTCLANGPYYYSSYGDEPHGNGNGQTVKVSRIVDGARSCCVHITTESGGALGWTKKDSLQVVEQ